MSLAAKIYCIINKISDHKLNIPKVKTKIIPFKLTQDDKTFLEHFKVHFDNSFSLPKMEQHADTWTNKWQSFESDVNQTCTT